MEKILKWYEAALLKHEVIMAGHRVIHDLHCDPVLIARAVISVNELLDGMAQEKVSVLDSGAECKIPGCKACQDGRTG